MTDNSIQPRTSMSGLDTALAINPNCSEGEVRVIEAAMRLQEEIGSVSCALLTPPDSVVPSPNQPIYGAGDVEVVVTALRRISGVMYEVDLSPDGSGTRYGFVLTLQTEDGKLRPHKDNRDHVLVRKGNDGDEIPGRINGERAMRAREIILNRATRQLREDRLAKSERVLGSGADGGE